MRAAVCSLRRTGRERRDPSREDRLRTKWRTYEFREQSSSEVELSGLDERSSSSAAVSGCSQRARGVQV